MYSEPLYSKTIETPIPVIDGYITFFDNEIGIHYKIKVTQKKSYGAVYADDIKEVSHEHAEIITMMLRTDYMQTAEFTRQQLMSHLKMMRGLGGKEVKTSPFSARVSELVRKGVLVKSTNKKMVTYHVNIDYAKKCLETEKF